MFLRENSKNNFYCITKNKNGKNLKKWRGDGPKVEPRSAVKAGHRTGHGPGDEADDGHEHGNWDWVKDGAGNETAAYHRPGPGMGAKAEHQAGNEF